MAKIKIPELLIEVEDIYDLNDQLTDMLEDFTDSLDVEDGYLRETTPDDTIECEFVFTWKGMTAINAERDMLYNIACKYFPDEIDEINIQNNRIKEE